MSEKIAIVTGGSKGIGAAICCRLYKEGYNVFHLSRTKGSNNNITWIPCDLSDEASIQTAFNKLMEKTSHIDIFVNNGGYGISGAAEFCSSSEISKQLSVNLMGAILITNKIIPVMRKQGYGKILFTSSLASVFSLPYQSYYSISKSGINSYSDALHIELRPFGIQTCAVLLNDVSSSFTAARSHTITGDDIYNGHISRSVSKMELSEQNGMSTEKVSDYIIKLLHKKNMPPHLIPGCMNKCLVVLFRILPSRIVLYLLGKLYG